MMLKKALFIILTSLICLDTYSQWVLNIDFSYKYLNVPQWDKVIQTYNLSRPHLTNKQPLLKHGYSIKLYSPKLYWHPKSTDALHLYPTISYSNYRSTAQNENFKAQLNLDIIDIGDIFYAPKLKFGNNFRLSFSSSLRILNLTRKINDLSLNVDSNKLSALGLGCNISFRLSLPYTSINLNTDKMMRLSPFMSFRISPLIWASDAESILNQTYNLITEPLISIFEFTIGFNFFLPASKHKNI